MKQSRAAAGLVAEEGPAERGCRERLPREDRSLSDAFAVGAMQNSADMEAARRRKRGVARRVTRMLCSNVRRRRLAESVEMRSVHGCTAAQPMSVAEERAQMNVGQARLCSPVKNGSMPACSALISSKVETPHHSYRVFVIVSCSPVRQGKRRVAFSPCIQPCRHNLASASATSSVLHSSQHASPGTCSRSRSSSRVVGPVAVSLGWMRVSLTSKADAGCTPGREPRPIDDAAVYGIRL